MIDKIVNFIRPTQSTVYDTESLTTLESIGKVIEKVNNCIENFNNLEIKTTNDYNNFLLQIKKYKNEIQKMINLYHDEVIEYIEKFEKLINALENIEETVDYIQQQSKFVQDLAKKNQDEIDKATVVTRDEITKLENDVKSKANKNYLKINMREMGVKCDGTDELEIISNIINLNTYNYDATFYFPSGDYLISGTLKINKRCNIEMDRGARIYTNNELDYLIEYLTEQTSGKENVRSIKNHWYGGVLDGNDKVKCLIAFGCYTNFVMEDVCFYKFLEKGLMTRKVGADIVGTGGFMGNQLYFRNWTVHLGTIAIYNNGHDNKFYNITIQNIEQATDTIDGIFTKLHHWQDKEALFPTTKFAHVRGSYAIFDKCIIDTIRVGFTSEFNVQVRVNLCNFIASNSVYTEEVAQEYGFTFFSGEGYYYASDILAYIDYGTHTICDSPRNSHIFTNCRFRSNGTILNGTYKPNTFEDNIRKGTLNNPDLNEYINYSGHYKIGSASNGSNFPESSKESGNLDIKVFGKDDDSKIVIQIFYPNSTIYKFYIRRYIGSNKSWTSWGKIVIEQDR